MRLTLSAKEVQLLRKICYKFNIEDAINEEIEEAAAYGYLEIEETQIDFTMIIAEKPIVAGLEVISKMAPKIMQVIGALQGVYTLAASLFNKKFFKEVNKLVEDLTFSAAQVHELEGEVVLEINSLGNLVIFEAMSDTVILTIALDMLTKEYSSKKELQNTVVGKNIANTVYTLEKALEKIKEEKASEGGRS